MTQPNSQPGLRTLSVHAGQHNDPATGACAVPLYLTSAYGFETTQDAADIFALKAPGNIYTRLGNPTTDVLEQRVAAIDGGVAAIATSSGMAAIFLAVTNLMSAGDHMIATSSLYGGTMTLLEYDLPRFGMEVTFIDEPTPEKISAAIRPNTKLVYIETIGNPKNDIPDIRALADAAHAAKVPLAIDNTFAPGVCRPIEHGADLVIYSLTKWMAGHGTVLGGMIVDSGKFDWAGSGRFPGFCTPDPSYHGLVFTEAFGAAAFVAKARTQGMRNMGMCLSPFNAHEILLGVETLMLRMKAHGDNALKLAQWLAQHPKVASVNFPGLPTHPDHERAKRFFSDGFFGSVIGMELKGDAATAARFVDALTMSRHLANVGDAKTLVINPWNTTHQQLSDEAKRACGMTPGFVRISVGLEDLKDIQADFERGFNA